MDYVLKPLARMGGIQKKKATIRFAEQGWLLIYCSIFWSLGMVRHFPLPRHQRLTAMAAW